MDKNWWEGVRVLSSRDDFLSLRETSRCHATRESRALELREWEKFFICLLQFQFGWSGSEPKEVAAAKTPSVHAKVWGAAKLEQAGPQQKNGHTPWLAKRPAAPPGHPKEAKGRIYSAVTLQQNPSSQGGDCQTPMESEEDKPTNKTRQEFRSDYPLKRVETSKKKVERRICDFLLSAKQTRTVRTLRGLRSHTFWKKLKNISATFVTWPK